MPRSWASDRTFKVTELEEISSHKRYPQGPKKNTEGWVSGGRFKVKKNTQGHRFIRGRFSHREKYQGHRHIGNNPRVMTKSSRLQDRPLKVTVLEQPSRSLGKHQVNRGKLSHWVHRKKAKVTRGHPKVTGRTIKVNYQGHSNYHDNQMKQINSQKTES